MKKSFYQAATPEEALQIYFEGDNDLYGQMKNKVIREMLREAIFLKENLWNFPKVLEIGAGGGVWTEFFIKNGASVTCVDISEQVLMGNKKLHPQARFVLADAVTVKIKERFNLVFAKDVIEHIQDDMQFLKNMNQHLKNNGLILINTQNCLCLNYLIQRVYHYLRGNKNWCGWDPTHVRFYNSKSLKRKLDSTGFRCVKWFGSYYFPYLILADRLNVSVSLKVFRVIELVGLCHKFPFNILGWNIGVVAQKVKSI